MRRCKWLCPWRRISHPISSRTPTNSFFVLLYSCGSLLWMWNFINCSVKSFIRCELVWVWGKYFSRHTPGGPCNHYSAIVDLAVVDCTAYVLVCKVAWNWWLFQSINIRYCAAGCSVLDNKYGTTNVKVLRFTLETSPNSRTKEKSLVRFVVVFFLI